MLSIVDDLILLNYIDSGCFAEIYLSKKRGSDLLLATKKISLHYISVEPLFKTSLQNEINFMKEFDHPNIIKLYDVKLKQDYIYLVMEYCNGGSLKKALNDYQSKYGKPFSEEIVKYLMRQILSAVDYLHALGIVHRDLKLENILLKYDPKLEKDKNNLNLNILSSEIKIIDFNISTRAREIPKNKEFELKDDDYEDNNYNEKIDIWFLGLLCYEMLFGDKIFGEDSHKMHINDKLFVIIPQRISLEAQTFLLSMLQTNPKKRLSAKELLKHNFLKYDYSSNLSDNNNINTVNNAMNFNNVDNNNFNSVNNIDSIDNWNTCNINPSDKSNVTKKLSEKNLDFDFNPMVNTPVNRSRFKTLVPEDRLRLSATLFKQNNHKKLQTLINSNNINKIDPILAPKFIKGGNTIKNFNNNTRSNLKHYTCTIHKVGKSINHNNLKIIMDLSTRTYLSVKGKLLAAEKIAKEIKKAVGENWLVFISNEDSKNYDFFISAGKKEDYISFSLDNKLFQIFKYN